MQPAFRTSLAGQAMRTGLNVFRLFLALGWALMLYVTVKAITTLGTNAAGATFFGDMAHPWRAQFNSDFGFHLLLVAAWFIYRDRSWLRGIVFGLLAINLGSIFTFAFLFIETFRTNGDMRRLLLGDRP